MKTFEVLVSGKIEQVNFSMHRYMYHRDVYGKLLLKYLSIN